MWSQILDLISIRVCINFFFQISTGGIIFFYSEEWAISVVAPLASDIDLSCPAQSNENVACYDFREDPDLLYWAKSIIANRTGNDTFKPTSLIIATWNQVQRFGCPEDLEVPKRTCTSIKL